MSAFRVIIPARYASSRLPGKPLLPLAGKPMVLHVVDRAKESGARSVLVATDDERIADVVRATGVEVNLTSAAHASGTDRLAEVATRERYGDDEIIVNLQGDEPMVPGSLLADLARALDANRDCGIATLATPISTTADVFNPNVVKVVLDVGGRALLFSRAPIPWARDVFSATYAGALPEGPYLRHLGLYAYRVGTLRRIAEAPQAPLEQLESLEQLRAMALGIRIHVSIVPRAPGHGVDTPDDLDRADRAMADGSWRGSGDDATGREGHG